MAPAGGLLRLMLAGLPPLLGARLDVGKERHGQGHRGAPGTKGAPSTLSTPGTPAANKSVLLVVAGLARHMEQTWPRWEKSLIVPNEEAGYAFTILFSTNAALGCRKGSSKWHWHKCEVPVDRDENVREIKRWFAPRAVTVLDYVGDATRQSDGIDYETSAFSPDVHGDDDAEAENYDLHTSSWWDRVHHALDNIEAGARFDRVVALRPDVVLGLGQKNERHPKEVDSLVLRLDEMCEKKPGFSIVDGSWKLANRFFHNRDIDFMQILCPGEKVLVYKEALRLPTNPCVEEPIPTLPPGFITKKRWTIQEGLYCEFVKTFQINNITMSNWDDDYLLSFLPRERG